jgi:transcriptional regulator with XRE-family HTH domain
MASLGQELKRERELRGISLREIADSTRINLKFLQALEEDRLEVIPGTFFVRAILRAYARTIGIDEHQVLNRYQEVYTFEEQLQYGESLEPPKPRPRPLSRLFPRKGIWITALALAVSVLGLILVYIFFLAPEERTPVSSKPSQPAAQVEIPKRHPPLEPLPIVEEGQGLRLDMTFAEETWIHVYADGESVWDGIKNKGDSLNIKAEQEVRLSIGNAGGPMLTINGQKAKPLGPNGAVRLDIRITPGNYRDFLVAEAGKTN